VSHDGPEEEGGLDALKKFVAERKIAWPQYYQGHDNHRVMTGEPVGDFSESWGISGIPTVFLVDAEGKLYSTEAETISCWDEVRCCDQHRGRSSRSAWMTTIGLRAAPRQRRSMQVIWYLQDITPTSTCDPTSPG